MSDIFRICLIVTLFVGLCVTPAMFTVQYYLKDFSILLFLSFGLVFITQLLLNIALCATNKFQILIGCLGLFAGAVLISFIVGIYHLNIFINSYRQQFYELIDKNTYRGIPRENHLFSAYSIIQITQCCGIDQPLPTRETLFQTPARIAEYKYFKNHFLANCEPGTIPPSHQEIYTGRPCLEVIQDAHYTLLICGTVQMLIAILILGLACTYLFLLRRRQRRIQNS